MIKEITIGKNEVGFKLNTFQTVEKSHLYNLYLKAQNKTDEQKTEEERFESVYQDSNEDKRQIFDKIIFGKNAQKIVRNVNISLNNNNCRSLTYDAYLQTNKGNFLIQYQYETFDKKFEEKFLQFFAEAVNFADYLKRNTCENIVLVYGIIIDQKSLTADDANSLQKLLHEQFDYAIETGLLRIETVQIP